MKIAGPLCWVTAFSLGCGNAVVDEHSAAGQGGASSATQAASGMTSQSSASASSTPASSGTGPSSCEAAPDCYMTMGGCLSCAYERPCSDSYQTCMNSADCSAYDMCRSGCNQQQDCIQECGASYPMGVDPWSILAACALCGACPNDCAAYASALGFSCDGL